MHPVKNGGIISEMVGRVLPRVTRAPACISPSTPHRNRDRQATLGGAAFILIGVLIFLYAQYNLKITIEMLTYSEKWSVHLLYYLSLLQNRWKNKKYLKVKHKTHNHIF